MNSPAVANSAVFLVLWSPRPAALLFEILGQNGVRRE